MISQNIHSDSMVIRNADILFSKVDNELLAFNVESGYCYSLNDTAGRIWTLIDEPISVSGLSSRLCGEFSVDEETCLQDALELLRDLQKNGLVKVNDA